MPVLNRKKKLAAIRRRDPRWDGLFFFGVRTTGIYCRPICPARPLARNIEFFETAAAAEAAGYRACLRCRPKLAVDSPQRRGTGATVERALKLFGLGKNESVERIADQLGVSSRHLRRLLKKHVGVAPAKVAALSRLTQAKDLLVSGRASITDVAFASGYGSIRRFNEAFRNHYGLSPREMRKMQRSGTRVCRKMASPVGTLTVVASDSHLLAILWEDQASEGIEAAPLRHPVLDSTEKQLCEYFAGKRKSFELPLRPAGTDFQLRVWKELSKIPYGRTISYGEQARRIGRPSASRAVGAANGRNPLPIVVPCHRVVGTSGKLTGYAGGVEAKSKLLELERVGFKTAQTPI